MLFFMSTELLINIQQEIILMEGVIREATHFDASGIDFQ